jgi:peptidoglycan hydrolase-like protein with peptidoglycan-binding domain
MLMRKLMMLASWNHPNAAMLWLLLLPGAQAYSPQDSSGSKQDQSQSTSAAEKSPASPKPAAGTPAQRRPARVPIGQSRPTRDRYREIQQALADAGFYPHAVDGIWGKQSEAALKKYQQDQGLNPTGRLDSLTLIRLGLGPQYEAPEGESTANAAEPIRNSQ